MSLDGHLGRSIAEKNFKVVEEHFDGESWTGNGPSVLSDIVKEMCKTYDPKLMHRPQCNGFEVYPTEDCYSVDYSIWGEFFDEKNCQKSLDATKDSFAIHFWNFLSRSEPLPKNKKAAYIEIAKQYCPKVFAASGEFF